MAKPDPDPIRDPLWALLEVLTAWESKQVDDRAAMYAVLTTARVFMGARLDPWTHCFSCRAPLRGGATEHLPGCEILRMIEDVMGGKHAIQDTDPR